MFTPLVTCLPVPFLFLMMNSDGNLMGLGGILTPLVTVPAALVVSSNSSLRLGFNKPCLKRLPLPAT